MATLRDLDECTAQIASVVHGSAPLASWTEVRLVVRSNPIGSSKSYRFAYGLPDGGTEKGVSPDDAALNALETLVDRHRELCSALGQQPWFQMNLQVAREGRYKLDLEYRDHYEVGDSVRG